MEKRNYEKLMPPPKNLVKWALAQDLFKGTDKIIFSAEWIKNPLTGIKERMSKCVCTHCHETFYEGWATADKKCSYYCGPRYGIVTKTGAIENGQSLICPCCGSQGRLAHISNVHPDSSYNASRIVSCLGKIEDKLVLCQYMIIKQIFKDGTVNFEVKKWEAYIFEEKKCITLRGFTNHMGKVSFLSDWRQMSRYVAPLETNTWQYIFPYKKGFTGGTTMENSRLEQYLLTKENLYPIEYLRFYQRKPKIENIMGLNLTKFVAAEMERCGYSRYSRNTPFADLNWKEKSPYKILGLNREEVKLLKKYNWDSSYLELFKTLRSSGIKLVPDNISLIMKFNRSEVMEVHNSSEPTLKILKYLDKQSGDRKRPEKFRFLKDYWEMAEKMGYDLKNPLIKYPGDLTKAHNKAVTAVEWTTKKELIEKFEMLYSHLKELNFDDGSLCIIPAKDEKELIVEGKILKHCVGGYGKTHCEGHSIFFVRRAAEPQVPYFTLNVNLQTGKQIQLHGYNNERSGQEIPDEVIAFIDYWLKNIFRKFDIEKMEFIEKPNKTKKSGTVAA